MRIKIGDGVYTAAALDRITLRNLIRLEKETTDLGRPMRWGELRALADRVASLPEDEIESDDDFPWFLGMLVWAARLDAGEVVTFSEAVDFPMGDLEILPDPEDEAPRPAVRLKGEHGPELMDPPRARPASGRAAARRPDDRKAKAPKASVSRSSVG